MEENREQTEQQQRPVIFDVGKADMSHAVLGGTKTVNIYNQAKGAIQPSISLEEGDIPLSSSIVLHSKRPIDLDSRLFHGTFGNKILGNKDIVLKLAKDGERERKEAEIHHSLPDHPNLVHRIHVDTLDYIGQPSIYIAMELCETNLYKYLMSQKGQGIPFDSKKYLGFSKDIAQGLSFLHYVRIIHRDLKPPNVLLAENCTIAKIGDFGLSKVISGDKSKTKVSNINAGTLGWKSPEVINGEAHISTATDIYSAGIIFSFMWTYGKHPYGAQPSSRDHYILNKEAPDLEGILLENPESAEDLVRTMLNPNPSKRPTADEVLQHEILRFPDVREPSGAGDSAKRIFEEVPKRSRKRCLEGEIANLKKAGRFQEATNVLKSLRTQQKQQLDTTLLTLVECNIMSREFDEANKHHDQLVDLMSLNESKAHEIKAKGDQCKENGNLLQAFILFYTTARMVKIKAGGAEEAKFIAGLVKNMDDIASAIIEQDGSKSDIVTEHLLPSMEKFTTVRLAREGASSDFLKQLEKQNPDGGFNGVSLLALVEKTILSREYDISAKISDKLLDFMKLQKTSAQDLWKIGRSFEDGNFYVKAFVFYLLAAKLAKAVLSWTDGAKVILTQIQSMANVAAKMLQQDDGLRDIIIDHIVPSTYEFTVTKLKEEGRLCEAGYLLKQYKADLPPFINVLTDLAASEAKIVDHSEVTKVIEKIVNFAKLQQIPSEYLDKIGMSYEDDGKCVKAFIAYILAAEVKMQTITGEELVKLMLKLCDNVRDVLIIEKRMNQGMAIISNLIRKSMRKLCDDLKKCQNMTHKQNIVAQCWCLTNIGWTYYCSKDWDRAVAELESVVEVMRSELGETESKKYQVLFNALSFIGRIHFETNRKAEAIEFLEESSSMARDIEDADDEELTEKCVLYWENVLKFLRGECESITPFNG